MGSTFSGHVTVNNVMSLTRTDNTLVTGVVSMSQSKRSKILSRSFNSVHSIKIVFLLSNFASLLEGKGEV